MNIPSYIAQHSENADENQIVKKLYASPLRIKIEEEYAKSLSRLSQIPLGSQEEGWAPSVLQWFSLKKKTSFCCLVQPQQSLNEWLSKLPVFFWF